MIRIHINPLFFVASQILADCERRLHWSPVSRRMWGNPIATTRSGPGRWSIAFDSYYDNLVYNLTLIYHDNPWYNPTSTHHYSCSHVFGSWCFVVINRGHDLLFLHGSAWAIGSGDGFSSKPCLMIRGFHYWCWWLLHLMSLQYIHGYCWVKPGSLLEAVTSLMIIVCYMICCFATSHMGIAPKSVAPPRRTL